MRAKGWEAQDGGKTIVYARFVPIVRTFAAYIAGVTRMPYLKFLPYSVGGGIGWVFVATMAGYWLGRMPVIQRNFEKVIVVIVLVSLMPTIIEVARARLGKKAK